jgi:hypothetical protein
VVRLPDASDVPAPSPTTAGFAPMRTDGALGLMSGRGLY